MTMGPKPTFRIKILDLLHNASLDIGGFLGCFLTDYATSYRRLKDFPNLRPQKRAVHNDTEKAMRQRLYDTLMRLKRDGLIEKSNNNFWRITKRGRMKRKEMSSEKNYLPSVHAHQSEKSLTWSIIIFDIPEKQRLKRNWLRKVLRHLTFRMLQESVWIGKVNIPRTLIEDLHKLHLLEYVEILAITKQGSLRQLR